MYFNTFSPQKEKNNLIITYKIPLRTLITRNGMEITYEQTREKVEDSVSPQ